MKLDDYFAFCTETAYQAGRLILGYYQTGVRPDYKADDTPVTVADRQAEAFIRGQIEARYPTHAIVGEEYGAKEMAGAACRWIVDPIDGTKAFVRGVPLFGVLLGLEIDGEVEVGAAYFPALDEMLAAATGLGCWWNGRRAHVSEVDSLRRATMAFTDPTTYGPYGREAAFQRLQAATYYRAGWCDSFGYLLAATGRVELMLDPVMAEWDCAPFPPIFREAGGYFGDWQGHPTISAQEALATSQILLPEVLRVIQG
jgi:histidinol-phosphatase